MADLHGRVFTTPRHWSETEIRDLLDSPHCFSVDETDGFAIVRVVLDEAELLTLAVAPEARRRGIGRRLLKLAVATARRQGARRILLEVAADNTAALALYDRIGFREVARRHGYYARTDASPIDALVLSLPLDPT